MNDEDTPAAKHSKGTVSQKEVVDIVISYAKQKKVSIRAGINLTMHCACAR